LQPEKPLLFKKTKGGKMKSLHKLIIFSISVLLLGFFTSPVSANEFTSVDVGYQTGVNETVSDFAFGGALSGSENGDPINSLAIHLVNAPFEASVEYRVFTGGAWQA